MIAVARQAQDEHAPYMAMDLLDWVPLVRLVVQRLAATLPGPLKGDAQDLFQVGIIGLILAARKFEPERGYLFATFAEWRVRGEILDYLRLQDRESRARRLRHRQALAFKKDMEQRLGREVGWCETAEAMGVALERISIKPPADSLDEQFVADEDLPMLDMMGVLGVPANQESALRKKDVEAAIATEISHLSEAEQLVLQLYLWEHLKMREIADIMELTESRICQIYNKAIRKMQAPGVVARLRGVIGDD